MDKTQRKVPILNIFYMLSYVWDQTEKFGELLVDKLDDFTAPDLLATLFLMSSSYYLRVGLYREYKTIDEEIKGIKGKIDFKNSLSHLSFKNAKAYCSYDLLEVNNVINQIIKSTAVKLYRMNFVNRALKDDLNSFLLNLNDVDIIDVNDRCFDITFSSQSYYVYPLIKICQLINQSVMVSDDLGQFKFVDVIDNDSRMESLFELFAYRFYKKEYANSRSRIAHFQKKISWQMGGSEQAMKWLPGMLIDIVVENEDTVFIIDTKYYSRYYSEQKFGTLDQASSSKKVISGNLYQVFTYMNEYQTDKNIKGVLLYPTPYTQEDIDIDYTVKTLTGDSSKDSILKVKTINLSKDWKTIKNEMLSILN